MTRAPRPQRGVVLVAFMAMLSAVLLVGTMGWVMTMQRMQLAQNERRAATYIQEVQRSLDAYLYAEFIAVSNPNSTVTGDAVLAAAGVPKRWGLEVAVSDALTASGLPYRVVVAWLPTDTDDRNPPNLSAFKTTGQFVSCGDATGPCVPRKVAQASTLARQQDASAVTQQRLQTAAVRAQLYFKQRVLNDPERRVTVNYFRPTSGDCDLVASRDLPCHDAYESFTATADGQTTAARLGLSPEDLRDGWGGQLSIRNGPSGAQSTDSPARPETVAPPFSVFIRAVDPYGAEMRTVATQPLQ